MSIVFSSGMLIKRESKSRLPIKYSGSCSTTASAKANESFTVHSLLVADFKIGTRNFANLYVRVLISDEIGQKGRQLLISLWTLQSPFIIPGLVPTGLGDRLVSSDILLETTIF